MASSTIYGVQNAGYSFAEQFDIDVSFLDRINIQAQKTFFNGEKLPEYEWQTDDDLVRIGQFVQFINSHKDGFKWK